MKTKRSYVMVNRAAKAQATKQRICDAAVRLYHERTIEDFTLDEVGAGAGTTVQTVLRAFGSKEGLLQAALAETAARGATLKSTPPRDIPAAIGAIVDVYETMADLLTRRLADEARHPALKSSLDKGRANHREWVKTVFAPYLEPLQGSQRTELLDTLVAATDFYVWKLLRRDRGLSRAATEAVMRKIVRSVTQQEASHGKNSLVELVGRREPAA